MCRAQSIQSEARRYEARSHCFKSADLLWGTSRNCITSLSISAMIASESSALWNRGCKKHNRTELNLGCLPTALYSKTCNIAQAPRFTVQEPNSYPIVLATPAKRTEKVPTSRCLAINLTERLFA